MAANFAKLPGAAAQADVEGRGVTRLRRTLRDTPRNVRFALNSGSIAASRQVT